MVYKLKATIPISKVFMREYEVYPEMNLFSFNRFILNDLSFGLDQMVIFRAFDANGKMTSQYGMFDLGSGTIDNVTFADLIEKGEIHIEYCYDFRNNRIIYIDFEGEDEVNRKLSYPCVVAEKGHNPGQFSDKYEDYMYLNTHTVPSASVEDDDDLDDDEDEDDMDKPEEIYDENESVE